MKRYSKEFNEAVIRRYESGILVTDIYKEFNLDSRRLALIRERLDISHRETVSKNCWRKYTFDSKFFNNPAEWTEKQAYFLGWLYSDGYNNTKLGSIHLKLQERDRCILDVLRKNIQYTGPLIWVHPTPCRVGNKPMMKNIQNQFKLSITNKDLSKELDALGVNKGKSKNTGFPPFINESLYPHFIRGLWDGDGCFTGNKQNRFSASLFVNKKLSKDIQSIVRDKLGIRAHIKDAGCNKIVQLSITGNRQVLKFANYIYSKANFSLIRKFQIIERLLQYKLTLPNAGDFELVEEAATNFAQTRTKLETQL